MGMIKKCASCGGLLTASRKRQTHAVAGRELVITVATATCRSCGAVFLENKSLQRAELELACELALHGPVSGGAFRFLRKSLSMRAVELAALLAVTPETVSRWENDQRVVDKAAWLALGSLVLESASRKPETLARLRALRGGSDALPETRAKRVASKR